MNLWARVRSILLQPEPEWLAIESEPGDAGYLFTNYVAILAAIPPVATFIGTSIVGIGSFRVGLGIGLFYAVVTYVLTLVGVFVTAFIIDFLAEMFGAQKNFANAMRIAAYAPTAAWVAGVFHVIPFFGVLSIVGIYSIYLLHLGIGMLMKPAAGKGAYYTIAVLVCVIVVWFVVAGIPAMMFGMRAVM